MIAPPPLIDSRGMAVVLLLLLAACGAKNSNPAPPRLTAVTAIPPQVSTITVPVSASVADLEARLNAEVPNQLVEINKQTTCVKAAKVSACLVPKRECIGGVCKTVGCKIGLDKARITPDVSCRIVGRVTRGPIRLSGSGETIDLVMPVSATVSAKDIGKIIKSETATAAADVRAKVHLGMVGDWQPTAKVDIDYEWTKKPGISLLGQRITFAEKADPQLEKIIAKLEADIPAHLAKLHPRERIAAGWAKGFTSVMLNRTNPPVWLRITPQQLQFSGYDIDGDRLVLKLAVKANTETFVGNRPPDPPATPLPRQASIAGAPGFSFHIPVVADYRELEPVLAKALHKLSGKNIEVPGIGRIDVKFGKVTVYATDAGRLAIGVAMQVATPGQILSSSGTVWATGVPYNDPGSQRVRVRDLTVNGRGDDATFDIMLAVARSPMVMDSLGDGLSQNFTRDYDKLMGKIERALTEKRVGDFVLNARIDSVRNGVIKPLGQGLYMPVDATGVGDLRYEPRIGLQTSH